MSAGSSEGWGRSRICPTLASTWNSGPRYPLIVRAFAGDSTMTSFCVRDTGPSFWWRRQPGGVGTECYVQPDTSGVRVQEPVEDKVRSEEHTSELQSRGHLVCRLLLEKKKTRANLSINFT